MVHRGHDQHGAGQSIAVALGAPMTERDERRARLHSATPRIMDPTYTIIRTVDLQIELKDSGDDRLALAKLKQLRFNHQHRMKHSMGTETASLISLGTAVLMLAES